LKAFFVGIGKIIVTIPMKHFREGEVVLGCLPVLLLLSGCGGATPECDSLDTRSTVVKIISDDSNNALVNYAVKNSSAVAAMLSNTNTEAEQSAIWEKARQGAAYRLDDTIRTNSRSKAKRAVTCTGLLYATVEDVTAQKEVDFRVEQAADGKVSISVSPFQF
jgi:flagellar basal body-associated protein FliL